MSEYIKKWPVVSRLIDIENELQHYKPFRGFEHAIYRKVCEAEIAIGKTPPADVAPVVYGKWEQQDIYNEESNNYVCSICDEPWILNAGNPNDNNMYYCPNCGAKMNYEEK